MKVSYSWLQDFFEKPLPSVDEVSNALTFGAFEIDGVEQKANDSVIDVKVLPNRAHDCLCHRGIAKELSVLLKMPLKSDPLAAPVPALPAASKGLTVTVTDTEKCPVYLAARMTGVKIGPSPDWLKNKLEALGQRSINNVVDATNYVMLNLGQPLHAFDAKKLGLTDGAYAIGVRVAKKGEKITILGGIEYTLDESVQVITDASSDVPIAIAGIKGGKLAEVDADTTEIILESAKFDPVFTRRASQKLKLRTDASYRYENETPDDLPYYGLDAVVKLISEIAGGSIVAAAQAGELVAREYKLGISTNEVNRVLGSSLTDNEVSAILERFGFKFTLVDTIDTVVAEAPKHIGVPYKMGSSVTLHAPYAFDCSSFTAWLYVQGGISIPRISIDQFVWGTPIERVDLQPGDLVFSSVGHNAQHTWFETRHYLLGTKVPSGVAHVGIYMGDNKVINAAGGSVGKVVIEDLDASPSFGKTIVGYRRMADKTEKRFVVTVPFTRIDLRVFQDLVEEIGRVYGYDNIKPIELRKLATLPIPNSRYLAAELIRATLAPLGFTEVMTYSLVQEGKIKLSNALASDKRDLRQSITQGLFSALDLNEYNAPLLGRSDIRIFEIGKSFTENGEVLQLGLGARMLSGKKIVERSEAVIIEAIGKLKEIFGNIPEDSIHKSGSGELYDIDLDKIADNIHAVTSKLPLINDGIRYEPLSPYPFVLRDIALWTSSGTKAESIEETIRETAGPLLVRLQKFDEFTKDSRTSYAFHLVFQSSEKTLSDVEINDVMSKVSVALMGMGFEIR